MKHARQKIREAVAGILAGLAGGRVQSTRLRDAAELPAIGIYGNRELSQNEFDTLSSNKRYSRNVDLVIECKDQVTEAVDDAVDDLAAQVESLMAADSTLGGVCVDCALIETRLEFDSSTSKETGSANLIYRCWYRTSGQDPENHLG